MIHFYIGEPTTTLCGVKILDQILLDDGDIRLVVPPRSPFRGAESVAVDIKSAVAAEQIAYERVRSLSLDICKRCKRSEHFRNTLLEIELSKGIQVT